MIKINKKNTETIVNIVGFLLFVGFFGFITWICSRPQTTMTACGWEKEESENVWVCREYKQVNYKLEN